MHKLLSMCYFLSLNSMVSYKPLSPLYQPPALRSLLHLSPQYTSIHLFISFFIFRLWFCSWRVSELFSCSSCAVLSCKQLSWSQTARLQPLTKTAPRSSATPGQCGSKSLRLVLSNVQMNMNACPPLCRSRRGCSLCFRSLWTSAPAPNPSTASLPLIFSTCCCTSRVWRMRYSAVSRSSTSLSSHQYWSSPRRLKLPVWSRTPWQVR